MSDAYPNLEIHLDIMNNNRLEVSLLPQIICRCMNVYEMIHALFFVRTIEVHKLPLAKGHLKKTGYV